MTVNVADVVTVTDETTQGRGKEIEVISNNNERSQPEISILDGAGNGDILVAEDGMVTYVPEDDFVGEDSFALEICSGAECQTVVYEVNVQADTDRDGLSDATELGANALVPLDSDNDGTPDYQDLDSDNDGLTDEEEGLADGDGNGVPNYRQVLAPTSLDEIEEPTWLEPYLFLPFVK